MSEYVATCRIAAKRSSDSAAGSVPELSCHDGILPQHATAVLCGSQQTANFRYPSICSISQNFNNGA